MRIPQRCDPILSLRRMLATCGTGAPKRSRTRMRSKPRRPGMRAAPTPMNCTKNASLAGIAGKGGASISSEFAREITRTHSSEATSYTSARSGVKLGPTPTPRNVSSGTRVARLRWATLYIIVTSPKGGRPRMQHPMIHPLPRHRLKIRRPARQQLLGVAPNMWCCAWCLRTYETMREPPGE